MKGTVRRNWRSLNAATVGTAAYWRIAVGNASFHTDMKPILRRFVRGPVLDLGAGKLAWKHELAVHASEYVSGDFAPNHPDLDVVFDVTRGIPFANHSFGSVFCCSVLEHLSAPWSAFSEIARILKPDGVAVISLPFLFPLHDEPHDYFRFTVDGVVSLAERSGLEIVEIVVNGGPFHLMFNMASVLTSTVLHRLKLDHLVGIATSIWLFHARFLDNLFRLKREYASNHIVVFRKRDTSRV